MKLKALCGQPPSAGQRMRMYCAWKLLCQLPALHCLGQWDLDTQVLPFCPSALPMCRSWMKWCEKGFIQSHSRASQALTCSNPIPLAPVQCLNHPARCWGRPQLQGKPFETLLSQISSTFVTNLLSFPLCLAGQHCRHCDQGHPALH